MVKAFKIAVVLGLVGLVSACAQQEAEVVEIPVVEEPVFTKF